MRLAVVGATRRIPGLPARLRRLAKRLAALLGTERASATLLLTDDPGIADLNARFRGKPGPTDVLSFPAGPDEDGSPSDYLGDLAISLDRAAAQAKEHGHSPADEADVLLLHGILHLLGHDHETDGGEMRALETRLAREIFGTTRGLIARTDGASPAP